MKTTAVSIRADRPYIKALNELAERQGKRTADLVRDALDSVLAPELAPLIVFFAESGRDCDHSVGDATKGPAHVG